MNTSLSETNTLPELIVCFSHLRWDFVFQRPQHILTRLAQQSRIWYFEEPHFHEGAATLITTEKAPNITVIVPQLPAGSTPEEQIALQHQLVAHLLEQEQLSQTAFWYYTPMALNFTRSFEPALVIFDCMDELSAFKFAPKELLDLETELLRRADVVFTGGASLYAAKANRHANIHLFPSSIDKAHFGKARDVQNDPADQEAIAHPRLGFFGVIDERFDIELIGQLAARRPEWQLVMIGPVVKIDPATLPVADNIHYLGGKSYQELPAYLANWDIALIPFALNESTRFISPTKTPEYLAAGKPVISSPLRDVVSPYGEEGLVAIAENADAWETAAARILAEGDRAGWLQRVDAFLEGSSWDQTCLQMQELIGKAMGERDRKTTQHAVMA